MTDTTQAIIPKAGAIILAGGPSSRMGQDKAELRLPPPDGPRVISHVINALKQVVSGADILIVGEGREMLGYPTVPDVLPGHGPLVGLYSGLRETQREWNFVLACDLPLVQPALLHGLLSLASDEYDAVVPRLEQTHTTCALYRRSIMPALERLLAEDVRRMRDLLPAIRTRYVEEDELKEWDEGLRSFVNLNTWGDYERVAEVIRLEAEHSS